MTPLHQSPFLSSAAVEPVEALPAEDSGTGHNPAGSEPDDISCIGEIFVGARKLACVPEIFDLDPSAITTSDHVLYDVLKAMVDPRLPGLREIPDEQALFQEIEPMPLLRRA